MVYPQREKKLAIKTLTMKLISILIIMNHLISCNSQVTNKETKLESTNLDEIINLILNDYKGVNSVVVCEESLNYNSTEIVAYNKSLKQALDIDLIEEFQQNSPGNSQKIGKFINKEDFEYMRKQIDFPINWNGEKLNKNIDFRLCNLEKEKSNFNNLYLQISKPLFNKDKTYSIIFVAQSHSEYIIKLLLLQKNKNGWEKVLNLNM